MHSYSLQLHYNLEMIFYLCFTPRTYPTTVGIFKIIVIKFVRGMNCKYIALYVIVYGHLVRINNSSYSMTIVLFLFY
jgi:hypothetical protein